MAVLDFFKKNPDKGDDKNAQNAQNSSVGQGAGQGSNAGNANQAAGQAQGTGAQGTQTPATPQPPNANQGSGAGQTTTTSQTTVSQTQTSGGSTGGSYNGIGSPSSGQSYNGIGSPPSSAAPPNNINTTKTTTTTNTDGQNQQAAPPAAPPAPDQNAGSTGQQPQTGQQAQTNQQGQDAQSQQGEGGQNKTDQQSDQAGPAVPEPEDKENVTSNIDNKKRSQLDLMTHLTQRSNRVFVTAQQKAQELQSEFVDSEHVLHGLLADSEVFKIFTDLKIQPQNIEQELEALYKKGSNTEKPQMSPRVKKIMDDALVVARKLGYEFISPEHILLALYNEDEGAGAQVLKKLGVKKEDLNKHITGKKKGLDEKQSSGESSTSTLEQYTKDLTAKAESGQLDPVVERSDIIERTIHIISRRTKNNPVLVGEAGVGKTAVVEGLAQKIAAKEVPESLLDKRILQLDLMAILAGASHRGDFEERMKKIIEEITAAQGRIILFIDEIHNLVGAGAGGSGSLDASNFLKPSLARGELQMIGATTLTEYRKYIEKDPALERRFQPVMTPEPDVESAIKMLKAIRDKYEAFHKVKIPDEAIEVAVKLSKRYVGDRFLPDKAVDLIDEAGSAVRLPLISLPEEIRSLEERINQLDQEYEEAEKRSDKVRMSILEPKLEELRAQLKEKQEKYQQKKSQTTTAVSDQSIKDIISRWTGVPVSKITESETEKLSNLEDIIHERLINQDEAVEPVAQAIRRGRAGLKSTDRPIGSFVFLGPTGVGKTELSKTLAEILFGQEEALIRFDMTEYMEKHEVAKLLGAPPGYVGYEEGGKLTEAVRRKPYSVVLFDEIEKAHPDIFNILLQILDDGRLTDNKGHVISFKNAVVICTSNIGTKMIQDEILATGQVDIEEPAAVSTYTFSPRGREILTILGKVFQRESGSGKWENMMLIDYFAGQKVQEEVTVEKDDGTTETQTKESELEFPGKEFDTHVMSPKGEEIITVGEQVYMRTSTTAKTWIAKSLIDYFEGHVVVNALPDAPEQQLPTAKLKTHAFSPQEQEVVSYRDRFWRRKGDDTNWETGNLQDYFDGHTLEGAQGQAAGQGKDNADESNAQTNAKKSNSTDSPDADAAKQPDAKEAQTNDTQMPQPKASKIDDVEEPEVKTEETPDSDKEPDTFPTNYWDIHGFTADGDEFIIVGEKMWLRKSQSTVWKTMSLHNYFGDDFPLEEELSEKQKIEEELAKNQYNKIKSKVMTELGKFFRPELINRFDEVTIFEPLKYHHMLEIAELQLKDVRKLLEDQNIGFDWTAPAKKEIVRQGFDPVFGARPLKRTIQKLIENPISTLIIQQKVDESDMIVVDFDGDKFVFNIERVKFVKKSELEKQKVRTFMCTKSHHKFETEVVPNAQVICPIDANEPVQEVVANDNEKDTSPDAPEKKPVASDKESEQDNAKQPADSGSAKSAPQPNVESQQNGNSTKNNNATGNGSGTGTMPPKAKQNPDNNTGNKNVQQQSA